MREIIFRGKRKNGDEWLIGDLLRSCNGGTCIFPNNIEMLTFNSPDWFEVDPETVGQYTGLKDNKGQEIYEGDIIEMEGKYQYVVVFEDAKFVCYHAKQANSWGKWGNLHRFSDYDFKEYTHYVIGNKFENPELIADAM